MRGADFSELRRKDVWSIPLTILREAVVNAVVHADYSQRGGPIRIAFFDDRIEIENPGILLPGMTVEDMLQGVSKIRNHVIARVFRELDLIEQWGSGVRRMFKEAEVLGLPQPEIIEVGMRVRFIVYLAESLVLPSEIRTSKEQVPTQLPTQLPTQFGITIFILR
jgi:predicted HTH transcriptional regulator